MQPTAPHNTDNTEPSAGENGLEQLAEAADKLLAANYQPISDKIVQKAADGDLASMKFMVALAERRKPRAQPVNKARGPSTASRWAAELEWND